MVYPITDIANKILSKGKSDENGELITNLKLQKLLYYMQGFHLAYFGDPLFEDEIEAWMYGPVVPSVYREYKSYGNSGIAPLENKNIIDLTIEEERLFNEVYRVYGKYSAIGLMNMTHEEQPWKTTETGEGNIIGKEKMKAFFKKRLK